MVALHPFDEHKGPVPTADDCALGPSTRSLLTMLNSEKKSKTLTQGCCVEITTVYLFEADQVVSRGMHPEQCPRRSSDPGCG